MLEPAAPGTEDEFQLPQVSKKETEQERLLSQKAYFSNGKLDNVFELSFVNGIEHWYCKLCQCPVMGKPYHHEIGKRHTLNLNASKNKVNPRNEKTEPEPEPVAIEIAPGEPIPPGFEEEVDKVAQIQDRLNAFRILPLVGLEYVLELQDAVDMAKEPGYLCVLCDKKGDPRTVLTHLSSYNHISQYLQKHFRTAYCALTPYMTKQYKPNFHMGLQRVAEAIETRFGRLKPLPVELDKFEKNRMHYLGKIAQSRHFQEGPNCFFDDLVKKEEMTKPLEGSGNIEEKLPIQANKQKPPPKKDPSPPVVQRPMRKPKSTLLPTPPNSNASKQSQKRTLNLGKQNSNLGKKDSNSGRQNSNSGRQNSNSGRQTSNLGRKKSMSPVSSNPSSDLSDFDPGRLRQARRSSPARRRSRERDRSPRSRRPFSRKSPSPKRGGPRRDRGREDRDRSRGLPWERPNYRNREELPEKKRSSRSERNEKLEEYKKLAKAIENDMERILKQHEKNPEKHPQYNEEWKKFWNKRYKELQADGQDASKHDYKPEWIIFWNKRMKELHDEDVKVKKDALRKRLGLPEEPAPIKFRISSRDKSESSKDRPVDKKPIPPAACPDSDPEVIIIDDKEDSKNSKFSSGRSRSPCAEEPKTKQRKIGPKPNSKEKSVNRRSVEKKPIERRSLDRLSLDRISSSGSSSDDDLGMSSGKHYPDVKKRSSSRDMYDRDKRRSPSSDVEYPRSRHGMEYRHRERMRMVPSDLLWGRHPQSQYKYYEDVYAPPKVLRDVTHQPVLDRQRAAEDEGDLNIVAVLRLLTALEDKLGSLGPKVNDLLAQALAMEKNEANSSEKLLDNDINCILFETVKEKLKGQLLAGLVDYIQERAFKNAIKKTASLIHLASTRKERSKLHNVPGVGTVDKAAIARQIATALIIQGKTDVTQAELEQLINTVVSMAEASQKSDKPMMTADFLSQLSGSISKSQLEEQNPPIKIDSPKHVVSKLTLADEKAPAPLEFITKLPVNTSSSMSNMDHLSDSDLQTLLQNFKDLSAKEQHGLINYLKTLEEKEPERVEELRKFVNLGPRSSVETEKTSTELAKITERTSGDTDPEAVNKDDDEETNVVTLDDSDNEKKQRLQKRGVNKDAGKVNLDSEEEEYTFEDVVKAVSKNVNAKEAEIQKQKEKEEEEKQKNEKEQTMLNTQTLISNLISNFTKPQAPQNTQPTTFSAADIAKQLGNLPINLDSLLNIVGNVKSMNLQSGQLQAPNQSKVERFGDDSNSCNGFEKPPRLDTSRRSNYNQFDIENSNEGNVGSARMWPGSDRPSAPDLGPKSYPQRGELFDHPEPGFNRNASGFNGQPGLVMDKAGPGFDRSPSLSQSLLDRPGLKMGRPMSSFDMPGLFDRPIGPPSMDRPGLLDRPIGRPSMDRPGLLDRPIGPPSMDRPGLFDRPIGHRGMDRPGLLDRPIGPPTMDRPGLLDKPIGPPSMDRSMSSFDRPGLLDRPIGPPSMDRSRLSMDRPGPGMDRAGSGRDRLGQEMDRLGPEMDRAGPRMDRPGLRLDRSGSGMGRSAPGMDRPGPNVNRLGYNMDRQSPIFDRPGPGISRMGDLGINRQVSNMMGQRGPEKTPLLERPGGHPGFDKPKQGGDRSNFDRLEPSFNRSGGGFDRTGQGFSRGATGFDRSSSSGFDRQGTGFDGYSRGLVNRQEPPRQPSYDRFDIEKKQLETDEFDIPGPDGANNREFDRPRSDKLGWDEHGGLGRERGRFNRW